jgi:hypothetical protein
MTSAMLEIHDQTTAHKRGDLKFRNPLFAKASMPLLPVRRFAKWFRRITIKSQCSCELPPKRKQGRFYG